MASNKRFKLFSNKEESFHHGNSVYKFKADGRVDKEWKTFASAIDRIEQDLCGVRYYYNFRNEESNDISNIDKTKDLELVEYEVILKEVSREPVFDIITERQRLRLIRNELGWQIAKMYTKINKEGLADFRYMLAFDNYNSFKDAQARLKELDISHGRQYRYCQYVIIFSDLNDATLCKLTFTDQTSALYDLETLKKLNIQHSGGQY